MNKIQKIRILKDRFYLSSCLIGAIVIFLDIDLEARILGAFLLAYGLTRFSYDATLDRMERELSELKNKDKENQNMSN